MKQTAVQWLEKCINIGLTYEQEVMFEGLFEQAKAMEKEQIIEAYNISWELRDKPYATADRYYKETYEAQDISI